MKSEGLHQISWKVCIARPRGAIFELLATDRGRERFWVHRSEQLGSQLTLRFLDGTTLKTEILESSAPTRFALEYFNHSHASFTLERVDDASTVVHLLETGLDEPTARENRPGWVSVLLNLKAVAQLGVDLRNHDPRRSWTAGYVDV